MDIFRKGIGTIIQLALWSAFLLALFDTSLISGHVGSGSIYETYAAVIAIFYQAGAYITLPLQMVATQFGWFDPTVTDSWFPLMSAPELNELLLGLGFVSGNDVVRTMVEGFFSPTLYPGAFAWWFVIGSIFYHNMFQFVGWLIDRTRNWFWNVVVEYGFHSKKAKRYLQAYEQSKQDQARIESQRIQLAHETHSLKDSVITDEMTRVFNKRFMLERLKQEFDACKQQRNCMSLIMVDIDFFKKLNDNYGHLPGDEVLKAVASILKRFTPDQCYPCRFGGEEFGIILPRRNMEEAVETARLMQEQVQKLRFPDIDKKLRVTISQGVCTVNFNHPDSETIRHFDDILQIADQQLYKSKENGRNRVTAQFVGNPAAGGQPQAQAPTQGQVPYFMQQMQQGAQQQPPQQRSQPG